MSSVLLARLATLGIFARQCVGRRLCSRILNPCRRLFLVCALTCFAAPSVAAIDCGKALVNNSILRTDIVAMASVQERFMFFFDSEDRDLFPGARLRIKFRSPMTVEDLTCLDKHVPILFIDGFRFPQQPIRYQPSNSLSVRPGTTTSVQQSSNEAAGGSSGATAMQLLAVGSLDTVEFQLESTTESKQIWLKLHRNPRPDRSVEIGLGFNIAAEGFQLESNFVE